MYLKIFKESWHGLRKNLILLLPDILLIAGVLVFMILFLLLINTFPGFERFSGITSASDAEQVKELILGFVMENPLSILFSLLGFLATVIFYGATTNVWKFNMMRYIVNNKKFSLFNTFKEIKEFYWSFIGVNILVILITSAVAFLVIILAYFIKVPEFWKMINIIALTLVTVIFIYKEAILFLEKKGPLKVIKHNFKFFFEKITYVLFTWLIVAVFSIVLSLLFVLASYFKIDIGLALLLIISFIVSIWADLFFFYAYKFSSKKS